MKTKQDAKNAIARCIEDGFSAWLADNEDGTFLEYTRLFEVSHSAMLNYRTARAYPSETSLKQLAIVLGDGIHDAAHFETAQVQFSAYLNSEYVKWCHKQLANGRTTKISAFLRLFEISEVVTRSYLAGKRMPKLENVRIIARVLGDEAYIAAGFQPPDKMLSEIQNAWPTLSSGQRESIMSIVRA